MKNSFIMYVMHVFVEPPEEACAHLLLKGVELLDTLKVVLLAMDGSGAEEIWIC